MDERARHLGALEALVEQRRSVERLTDLRLLQARDAGATWQQLGAALGITRQAAQLRHERAEKQRGEQR